MQRFGLGWAGEGSVGLSFVLGGEVFPPTLVKEDEALPETADCRMDLELSSIATLVAFGELMLQSGVLRFEPTDSLSSARSEVGRESVASSCRTFANLLRTFATCFTLCVLARNANPLSIEIAGFSATGDNTNT